jgi:hypothetical protein
MNLSFVLLNLLNHQSSSFSSHQHPLLADSVCCTWLGATPIYPKSFGGDDQRSILLLSAVHCPGFVILGNHLSSHFVLWVLTNSLYV